MTGEKRKKPKWPNFRRKYNAEEKGLMAKFKKAFMEFDPINPKPCDWGKVD